MDQPRKPEKGRKINLIKPEYEGNAVLDPTFEGLLSS
jgi:hypothetical protein